MVYQCDPEGPMFWSRLFRSLSDFMHLMCKMPCLANVLENIGGEDVGHCGKGSRHHDPFMIKYFALCYYCDKEVNLRLPTPSRLWQGANVPQVWFTHLHTRRSRGWRLGDDLCSPGLFIYLTFIYKIYDLISDLEIGGECTG